MDEERFKSTHAEVNEAPCVFAKAVLARCASCSRQQRLLIAERETLGCKSPQARARCGELASLLRKKALFALRLTHLDEPLPHGKEIRVQCGGLKGLANVLNQGAPTEVWGLVRTAVERFGAMDAIPYPEIVKAIAHYQPRRRSRK